MDKNKILKLSDNILNGNYYNFPEFDLDKHIDMYETYPCYYYSKAKEIYIKNVNIDLIYGTNWCFESKQSRGSYPNANKIYSILNGHVGNYFYNEKEIPPVHVTKILDMYILEEGNHRLYTIKLLNLLGLANIKEIKCIIEEREYKKFIQECIVNKRKVNSLSHISQSNEVFINEIYFNEHEEAGSKIYSVDNITVAEYNRILELKKVLYK